MKIVAANPTVRWQHEAQHWKSITDKDPHVDKWLSHTAPAFPQNLQLQIIPQLNKSDMFRHEASEQ